MTGTASATPPAPAQPQPPTAPAPTTQEQPPADETRDFLLEQFLLLPSPPRPSLKPFFVRLWELFAYICAVVINLMSLRFRKNEVVQNYISIANLLLFGILIIANHIIPNFSSGEDSWRSLMNWRRTAVYIIEAMMRRIRSGEDLADLWSRVNSRVERENPYMETFASNLFHFRFTDRDRSQDQQNQQVDIAPAT